MVIQARGLHVDTVNVAGRLERLPISRFHILACSIIGAVMFFDGYDLAVTGLALPSLIKSGMLAQAGRAWFVSLPLFAAAFGSILAGAIGDRFGRRRLMVFNIVAFSLAGLACALASSYSMLLVLRTLGMIALGMQIPTGYAYMSEFTPHALRGRFQCFVALMVNGSLPVFAVIVWLVMPHISPTASWRVLYGLAACALPLAFAPRAWLPESPRWLVAAGRDAEAQAILDQIEAGFAKRGTILPPPLTMRSPYQDLGWSALIAHGMRRRTALALLFQILQLSSIFVMVSWLPTLMVRRGFDLGTTFGFAALTFAGNIVGPCLGILLADRFERRWTLTIAALVGAVMGMVYAHQTHEFAIVLTGIVLASSITFISAVGYGSYLPEIFPTGVRLRGLGLAALTGRIASALTPFAVEAALLEFGDPFTVIAGVGCMYALLALAFIALGPNTHGRTLEMLESQGLEKPRGETLSAQLHDKPVQ